MGSSGAGKTTFLNAICDRLATGGKLKLTGRCQLGDVEYERHYRRALGFVTQDDIVSSLSTPQDSFWFSLRTRRGLPTHEARERVDEMLRMLNLTHCRDTQVGIPGLVAGLSGGERKRCNIGIELICDPKVLLLDEPTSGLDSVTSAKVIHLLREVSREGRTCIYTIHQPTAEVLSYFDDVMLMTQGRAIYHGTMDAAVDYFAEIGFVCPEIYTPSDYFMTLMQDYVTSKVLIKRWRVFLKKGGRRTPHTAAIRPAPSKADSPTAKFLEGYISKFGSSPVVQFIELFKRSTIEMIRDKLYLFSHASQAIFFAVVVGLIFVNMKNSVTGIQDRQGMLFMTVMNRCMGACFIMLNAFYNIRAVYTREQQAACYSPGMYLLARSLAEFPMKIFFVIVECVILYFMVGLAKDPGAFFYYFGVIALVSEVGLAFGFMVSSLLPSLIVASAIVPLILLPLALAGGLFASSARLRPYWYWIEKPSFMRHAFILVARNEFKRMTDIECDYERRGEDYCLSQATNGNDVLVLLGFNGDPQNTNVWMWISLAILWVIFRVLTVIGLAHAARKKS
ncbi:ATP-binding protein cassette protein subfamily G, member 2 [Angomonas deanei]|nr:ATP-binding protein cassette protein subfamily G, member 2 [Angomonas deanei]|eukprot:EPY42162.1 ATP-binding protein cassette protein subfamily G, member 2 [Angomonas deanei]